MSHVVTILGKEWSEVRRNRLVLYVVVFVPLLMLAIPIVALAVLRSVPISPRDLEELGRMTSAPMFQGMAPAEAMQSALASSFILLFLVMPLMVPVTIAAYSIVGEKVTRSLEPLLATPISTTSLMTGKGLAAALPGIGMAWLCYALFLVFARVLAVSDRVFGVFVDSMWLVAMLVLAPLLTIMAVTVGIIVSSRTSDPRAAEQLGSLLVIPFMILFIGPMAGFIQLGPATFWAASAIVAVLDAFLLFLAVRLFQRETILTRWK